MNDKEYYCNLTALFWRYYLLEPTQDHFEEIFSYLSEELVIIGTGRHEFYTDFNQILKNMSENQIEAISVNFQVLDEWYECLRIDQEVFLVYGGIWVRQQGQLEDKSLIEMDTRFSVIYRKKGDKSEVIHIHHSIPYAEQQQGEYYPKTLSEKAKVAMNLAEKFKRQSELDLMTEVYNNVSFKHHVIQHMRTKDNGTLYLFDLDYFKSVNDTYGHATGDLLLIEFSRLLKEVFYQNAVIGRVGGDEFAVLEYIPVEKESVIKKINQMQKAFNNAAKGILIQSSSSFSVGIVSVTDQQRLFDNLFSNADKALYSAKKLGRKTHFWYCD
ncbi:MAG: diguanylate cyclase [Coprobacillus sp.]